MLWKFLFLHPHSHASMDGQSLSVLYWWKNSPGSFLLHMEPLCCCYTWNNVGNTILSLRKDVIYQLSAPMPTFRHHWRELWKVSCICSQSFSFSHTTDWKIVTLFFFFLSFVNTLLNCGWSELSWDTINPLLPLPLNLPRWWQSIWKKLYANVLYIFRCYRAEESVSDDDKRR